MDRDLTPAERRRRLARRTVPLLAVAGAGLAGVLALPRLLSPVVERDSLRIARVERGDVGAVIEATGLVEPASEHVVTSPIDARLLRVLRRPGASVAPGEPLVELDLAAARVDLDRLADRVATLALEERQAALETARQRQDLRSRIESRKLERDAARVRLERSERLRADGLISDELLDERRLELARADIDVVNLERSEISELQSGDARLEVLRLQLRQAERDREEQRRQLELASARSQHAGVVTWVLPDEGASVRRGDVLARVAALDAYGVTATVSDIHAPRLSAGMPVRVRGAGFEIEGSISTVHPAVAEGVVTFEVALATPSAPGLRPSLRVDAWVVGEQRRGVLRLPRAAATRGRARGRVFVVTGDVATPRDVSFGVGGPDAVEIVEGLAEGEDVIVSDMSMHEDATSVRIQ